MRCNDNFYRKSGRHVSNETNMCDDIYIATIVFGDSKKYNEISKSKLTRIELGPVTMKAKRSIVMTNWV
ncbi:MAG: hypothetical protein HY833_00160 [Candidatus Aenigmarchaeota archaeon]|nr:hypothetical protein [Candidatus Aenigmarchaeota archaeon]